jgi:hypothetical protein
VSEWQPIETAPRDGTIIDVWLQESLSDIRFYCSSEPKYLSDDKYGGRSAGWFWKDGKFRPYLPGLNMPVFVMPTHWMKLPEPPDV